MRTFRFYGLWFAISLGALTFWLRDIAAHPWIRETTLTLRSGGEPFSVRYVFSVIFYHHPLFGVVIAVIGGFSLTCAALAAARLLRRYFLKRRVPGQQKIREERSDLPADCPPITRTIPPRS